MTTATKKDLLAVIELGGYPNFSSIYEQAGFTVHTENSVRNAIRCLKKIKPQVVVAEFNFQSDFRDRTSSLESLLSTVQWLDDCQVIVFYEEEFASHLTKLSAQYPLFATLPFPIDQEKLASLAQQLAQTDNASSDS